MYTVDDKQSFLNLIKSPIIDFSISNRILPSVVAAIAIDLSEFGTSIMYGRTNNMFKIQICNDWNGWCYSEKSNTIYANKEKSKENKSILYKAYVEPLESLKDFLLFLKESRRSNNGPLTYGNVFGHLYVNGYIDAISSLEFDGFIERYTNSKYINRYWYSDIISIIENNKLYEWDNELINMEDESMSKKKKQKIKESSPITKTTPEFITSEHIYRVRLSWERPNTQIFASENYDEALEYALKHEGYKIYIDDDGELFEDPWKNEEKEDKPSDIPGIVNIIHPIKGYPITLKNENIYLNAIDKTPYMNLTGTFYFYDSSIVNKRAKITVHKNIMKPDPSLILGYIVVR